MGHVGLERGDGGYGKVRPWEYQDKHYAKYIDMEVSNPNIFVNSSHFSILVTNAKFSDLGLPVGQIIPTPCMSDSHPSKASLLSHFG